MTLICLHDDLWPTFLKKHLHGRIRPPSVPIRPPLSPTVPNCPHSQQRWRYTFRTLTLDQYVYSEIKRKNSSGNWRTDERKWVVSIIFLVFDSTRFDGRVNFNLNFKFRQGDEQWTAVTTSIRKIQKIRMIVKEAEKLLGIRDVFWTDINRNLEADGKLGGRWFYSGMRAASKLTAAKRTLRIKQLSVTSGKKDSSAKSFPLNFQ